MKHTYEVGDTVYVNVPYCGDEGEYLEARVKGKVEFWFQVPDAPETRYVVRLDDTDFPHLETRDAYTMAETEEGLLPFERPRVPPPGTADPTPPPGADPVN